uniref:EF-hand domain-containing protein n=1 Tax=Nelumbo nucifera TaxID=4432 RepID=A0A822Z3T3_NELNU|nr:TPA_asm: hypothetical protein HUJ06_014025 [Nelumbo nucifera]
MKAYRTTALELYSYSNEAKVLVEEAFKALASYNKSKVSCKEFEDLFSKFGGRAEIEQTLTKLNKDGNGYLDLQDFIALVYKFYQGFSCDHCLKKIKGGMLYSCVACIERRDDVAWKQ